MRREYKPSKAKAKAFAQQMNEIYEFCVENGISQSMRGDSYYFTIASQKYRVSNHSVESSTWHDGRNDDVIYIHAGKTRIIEIYENLKQGLKLDGRGFLL